MKDRSDKFFPLNIKSLLEIILAGKENGTIFGIDKQFIFSPDKNDHFRIKFFGTVIETPFGLAAGPHTQMAQNILSGWLTGARFIELKTIQVLDSIDVSKPCIDMRDEGYNCEWSQELSVEESFNEYLKAWILIHIVRSMYELGSGPDIGTVFNMSAGYDLKGIKSGKVLEFIEKMRNCKKEKDEMLGEISDIYPEISKLYIPDTISDNITISTMHGTPPEEIEAIGNFFMSELGLNTVLKLNPTLLGKDKLTHLLNDIQKFDINVPDSAFEHDPDYAEGINIIENLKMNADSLGVKFGIKLTNTLETINVSTSLPKNEERVYLSGRALHPIAVSLALAIRKAVGSSINISFSAGADAFNLPDLVAVGLKPVTVASDILRPGGYTRFFQYIEELRKADYLFSNENSDHVQNLEIYNSKVINDPKYKNELLKKEIVKGKRKLELFDCIYPPCMEECAASQDIPAYLKLTSKNEFSQGYLKVFETNPFPSVTGLVCDHKCQIRCTREYYDEAVKIKKIKHFLSDYDGGKDEYFPEKLRDDVNVAIIGGGPAGLTCAHYLSREGVNVTLLEKSVTLGGMVERVIPPFRLGEDSLKKDLENLELSSVNIGFESYVDRSLLNDLKSKNDFVFFATGAVKNIKLKIEGIESKGVVHPHKLLEGLKSGKVHDLGNKIAVIGGGNTAFDSARSVKKYLGDNGSVSILYRRGLKEMPAEPEEIKAAVKEGVEILVLTVPEKVISEDGKVRGLICSRTELSGAGKDGRPYPKKIRGTEFSLTFDSIIPALGQKPDLDSFGLDPGKIPGYENILIDGNIILGGDCGRGDKTVINAIGDGRSAAEFILGNISLVPDKITGRSNGDHDDLIRKRSYRVYSMLSEGGEVINATQASEEASRCLECDKLCDLCVTVCPNRANISYKGKTGPFSIPVIDSDSNNVTYRKFEINQEYQVVHITDLCNHCGNCTTFCPTSGKPFMDKPRLALSGESYRVEDNVFLPFKDHSGKGLLRKKDKTEEKIVKIGDKIIYSVESFEIIFNESNLKIEDIKRINNKNRKFDSESLFTMLYLLDNLPEFLFENKETCIN